MELVDKYHPDLLYFDGGIPHGQYGMQLIAHYLNTNAKEHNGTEEGVVNVKAGSFVRDYERGVSPTLQDKPWQDDTSLSGWFYMNHNPHIDPHSLVKSAGTVIDTLVDVVSKNGNLLMNFPQRGDGSLYPECEAVLDELIKWMPINGEGDLRYPPMDDFRGRPIRDRAKGDERDHGTADVAGHSVHEQRKGHLCFLPGYSPGRNKDDFAGPDRR